MTNESSRPAPFGEALPEQPDVRVAIAHDADEQARNLHGWRQSYDQLGAGRFTGTLAELFLDHMTVFREVTSHALRQTCEIDSDAYWFGVPQRCDGVGRIDGQTIGRDAVAFRPGSLEFELLTPACYEFFGIVVKGDVLREYAVRVEHLELTERAPATEVIDTGAARKARLSALLRPLLDHECDCVTRIVLSGAARNHLESSILAGLFDLCAVDHPQRANATGTPCRRQAVVSQARDYVLANRERPVSVPELCERLHVSRRTLQYCFQDALGMSPAAYLRMIRLNGVRRSLSNAAREPVEVRGVRTVQDIAAAWGFWHLSQFATDYRRLFGMRPSDTLKASIRLH
ncbi:helix-turn-helix domain-containing protein [Trinickia sp. LjRoot230]|uniref:helix-turn-helix domain-containing protein n=1 Tax=Trinickia sp. LjRoot230 TaxID=3342288 RepID=UPI003ECF937D